MRKCSSTNISVSCNATRKYIRGVLSDCHTDHIASDISLYIGYAGSLFFSCLFRKKDRVNVGFKSIDKYRWAVKSGGEMLGILEIEACDL